MLGTMEESSAGVYWMKNLEYGGVLVREKTAPEGFIPDEKAYYVEIDTDGKTYTVENEAGKGFINHALKGSLKIIKTTSDGKKEGFAFRITGANGYDMTFTTDAKGEIFIEKLRIGEYTVTELKNSASEGYKIADPVKITLVANETLTVKIHNDKTKVDVPKTGDDADLILWISLLGLAAAGAGCTAFFYLKKRRTSKHIAAKKVNNTCPGDTLERASPDSLWRNDMKNDRRRRNRPRNREKKGVRQSPGQECRHVWSGGVCLKCGCLQQPPRSSGEKLPAGQIPAGSTDVRDS